MSSDGWTISEALAQFAAQGMPVDETRFRLAVRAARLKPVAETRPGDRGGRGYQMFEIAQLQHLHAWLMAQDRLTET